MLRIADLDGVDFTENSSNYVGAGDTDKIIKIVTKVGGQGAQTTGQMNGVNLIGIFKIKEAGAYDITDPYYSWGRDGYIKYRGDINQIDDDGYPNAFDTDSCVKLQLKIKSNPAEILTETNTTYPQHPTLPTMSVTQGKIRLTFPRSLKTLDESGGSVLNRSDEKIFGGVRKTDFQLHISNAMNDGSPTNPSGLEFITVNSANDTLDLTFASLPSGASDDKYWLKFIPRRDNDLGISLTYNEFILWQQTKYILEGVFIYGFSSDSNGLVITSGSGAGASPPDAFTISSNSDKVNFTAGEDITITVTWGSTNYAPDSMVVMKDGVEDTAGNWTNTFEGGHHKSLTNEDVTFSKTLYTGGPVTYTVKATNAGGYTESNALSITVSDTQQEKPDEFDIDHTNSMMTPSKYDEGEAISIWVSWLNETAAPDTMVLLRQNTYNNEWVGTTETWTSNFVSGQHLAGDGSAVTFQKLSLVAEDDGTYKVKATNAGGDTESNQQLVINVTAASTSEFNIVLQGVGGDVINDDDDDEGHYSIVDSALTIKTNEDDDDSMATFNLLWKGEDDDDFTYHRENNNGFGGTFVFASVTYEDSGTYKIQKETTFPSSSTTTTPPIRITIKSDPYWGDHVLSDVAATFTEGVTVVGDDIANEHTINQEDTGSSGNITYSSSNTSIVVVDQNSGALTFGSGDPGTSTITITQAAADGIDGYGKYWGKTSSYVVSVTVVDNNVGVVTGDIQYTWSGAALDDFFEDSTIRVGDYMHHFVTLKYDNWPVQPMSNYSEKWYLKETRDEPLVDEHGIRKIDSWTLLLSSNNPPAGWIYNDRLIIPEIALNKYLTIVVSWVTLEGFFYEREGTVVDGAVQAPNVTWAGSASPLSLWYSNPSTTSYKVDGSGQNVFRGIDNSEVAKINDTVIGIQYFSNVDTDNNTNLVDQEVYNATYYNAGGGTSFHDWNFHVGDNTSVSVDFHWTSAGEGETNQHWETKYQWQKKVGSGDWDDINTDGDTSTLSINTFNIGDKIRVKISVFFKYLWNGLGTGNTVRKYPLGWENSYGEKFSEEITIVAAPVAAPLAGNVLLGQIEWLNPSSNVMDLGESNIKYFSVSLNRAPTTTTTFNLTKLNGMGEHGNKIKILNSSGTTEINSLTFTTENWNTQQNVGITANLGDGFSRYTDFEGDVLKIKYDAGDDGFDGVDGESSNYKISVKMLNNRQQKLVITAADGSNPDWATGTSAGSSVVTISLAENFAPFGINASLLLIPENNVKIQWYTNYPYVTLNGSNSGSSAMTWGLGEHTFTPSDWNTPKTVNVAAITDNIHRVNNPTLKIEVHTDTRDEFVSVNYTQEFDLQITQDETLDIVLTPDTTLVLNEGSGVGATFTIGLSGNQQPDSIGPDIKFNISAPTLYASDVTISPSSVTFTNANYSAKTITVTAVDNSDYVSSNKTFNLTIAADTANHEKWKNLTKTIGVEIVEDEDYIPPVPELGTYGDIELNGDIMGDKRITASSDLVGIIWQKNNNGPLSYSEYLVQDYKKTYILYKNGYKVANDLSMDLLPADRLENYNDNNDTIDKFIEFGVVDNSETSNIHEITVKLTDLATNDTIFHLSQIKYLAFNIHNMPGKDAPGLQKYSENGNGYHLAEEGGYIYTNPTQYKSIKTLKVDKITSTPNNTPKNSHYVYHISTIIGSPEQIDDAWSVPLPVKSGDAQVYNPPWDNNKEGRTNYLAHTRTIPLKTEGVTVATWTGSL